MANKSLIKVAICVIMALIALLVPAGVYGINGLTVVEQRVIAIFIFAALMWITEPVPIWTTSVMVMVLLLVSVTNSAFAPFNYMDAEGAQVAAAAAHVSPEKFPVYVGTDSFAGNMAGFFKGIFMEDGQNFGKLMTFNSVMAAFADPTIMLFMGGFVLAISASKIGLDGQLAKVLLMPFGKNPKIVMLGFLLVTAVFSMFISNTATAAMMLAIMAPVFNAMRDENGKMDRGCAGLAMAIPIGANIGGIGTPIGTPPNAIALKSLNDAGVSIGFGQWMAVFVPIVLVILFVSWFLLMFMFKTNMKEIHLSIDNEKFSQTDKRSRYIICGTFALTIFLWLSDALTGLNANVVALVPFAILAVTGLFTKDDLKAIDWNVLWLVAGGFALGVAFQKTGLAKDMVDSIPFEVMSPIAVMLLAGALCLTMATFMSHSAAAALLLPVVAGVAAGLDLSSLGGVSTMLLGVGLSASLAMALPISTPPNALAYSTGTIEQKDMATLGVIIGVFGFAVAYAVMIYIVGPLHIFG